MIIGRPRFILTSSISTDEFLVVVFVRLLTVFTLDDVTTEAWRGFLEEELLMNKVDHAFLIIQILSKTTADDISNEIIADVIVITVYTLLRLW